MSEDTESEGKISESPVDDERFEVKWKKKEGATRTPIVPIEPAEAASDAATLQRELEEAQSRIRDLQDKWQRAAADVANLRRRTEQERADMEKFASMVLVSELLPVLDNFERALATIPGNLAMLTWMQGVMLIERHLLAILEHQGLEPIEALGKSFSPHFHEAVGERETSDAAPGTVVQEYQKGYSMHGRVIRPALVEVAKAPAAEQSDSTTESGKTEDADAQDITSEAPTEYIGP